MIATLKKKNASPQASRISGNYTVYIAVETFQRYILKKADFCGPLDI
jgi:hypothetical protein